MISVPSIAGAPFSAVALSVSRQVMPDGWTDVRRVVSVVDRDSRGRTYGELRLREPMAATGMGELLAARIYDPHTGIRTTYYPGAHAAVQQTVSERITAVKGSNAPNSSVEVQDLGSKTIDDFAVKGTRRTVVVPAALSGTGMPITVVDEAWYSEELRVNLLQVHTDPRTGTLTVALSHLKREDPDPAFFKLPRGYRLTALSGLGSFTLGATGGGERVQQYPVPYGVPGADVPGDITGAW
jgi:hypothetical protein